MHKPLQALAAAIMLALTLGSANIFAADVRTYPGAMCQRHQNNDLNGLDYISGTAVNATVLFYVAREGERLDIAR
jgi:hypothetical protein